MPLSEQIEDVTGGQAEATSRIDPEILSQIFVESTMHSIDDIAAGLDGEQSPVLRQALVYADFICRTKGLEARDAFIEGVLRTMWAYNEQDETEAA
jgi:hypothetical protein